MKQYQAEVIAVGTELLLGQIANTNAQWLSEQLAKLGVNVYYHSVVGDNLTRVKDTFKLAENRSNLIIITGGLGPTDDDLTREAFQSITGMKMYEHKPSMDRIESFFVKRNSEMTPNNRKQARVFEDAIVLENSAGMAPGMIVNRDEKLWVFLPGVPREMKAIMNEGVLPFLKSELKVTDIIKSYVLRFIGIGESKLEHELHDIIQKQTNPTIAPLAQNDGIVIRLTAKAHTEEKAINMLNHTKNEIIAKVGSHYIGMDDQTIEQVVTHLLKSRKATIASAESLTGGKFIEKLISVPGASKVCKGSIVCYDESVKREVLNVSADMLQKFGTVSRECALELAKNVAHLLNSDIGISFTGIAGPDPIEGKPVGTVYISVYIKNNNHFVERFDFVGDRDRIRHLAVIKGYEILLNLLKINN